MSDPIAEFFDTVDQRCDRVRGQVGTIRVDVTGDGPVQHWFLSISQEGIHVSRETRDADCVLQVPRALFARIVCGQASLRAAWLRSEVFLIGGNLTLLDLFQRLLPGPPHARDPRSIPAIGGDQV